MQVHLKNNRIAATNRRGHFRGRAFTLVEVLVVIFIVALLMAILIPAVFAASGAGVRTESMNNLREIGQWMGQYQLDNREYIVPSQFDYSGSSYPGKVRDNASNHGVWSDIIWTVFVKQGFPETVPSLGHDYSHDSPDDAFYDLVPDFDNNPLRSAELNQQGGLKGRFGYFAANQFFNADPNVIGTQWWRIGQIAKPDASLYLIDSWEDEVIEDQLGEWEAVTGEVDYRYAGDALILFLDGHVDGTPELKQPWTAPAMNDLEELELIRKIRITNLDRR